jgi:hypothetical protein
MDLRKRISGARGVALCAAVIVVACGAGARAAVTSYEATLIGSAGSSATGYAAVDVDPVAQTMRVAITFSSLDGPTTAAHIHAPTATPGEGTAGVATALPYFPNFPIGVTAGSYDQTFDMTQAESYNPDFVTANGGTPASAEAALFTYIAEGRAYVNIHSAIKASSELRGFLVPVSTASDLESWGGAKAAYR